jgi:hypothetical protein
VKFRIGSLIAFCLGYLLGARAGRERYRQIVRAMASVSRSAPVSSTTTLIGSKSKAVANLGVERLKDSIGVHLGWRNGDQAADAIAADLAEDLATALNHRRNRPEHSAPSRHGGRRQVPAAGHASSR